MSKILPALALALMSMPIIVHADDIINADVKKAFEETNLSMQESMEQMNKSMQKVMPQIADSMSQMMNEVMKSLPPLMSALEKNQVLSKASAELNRQFQQNLKEVTQNFEDEIAAAPTTTVDEFEMSGSRNINGNQIDYAFTRNAEEAQKVAKVIDAKISGSNTQDSVKITDLKNYNIDAKHFKLDSLDGNVFLLYNPTPEQAFITGNFNNKLNIKIQAEGKDALKQAKDFITAFRSKYIK